MNYFKLNPSRYDEEKHQKAPQEDLLAGGSLPLLAFHFIVVLSERLSDY